MLIDFKQIDNIEFAGVDFNDYPDFCDAYIESCDYMGREATEEELDEINDDFDFVYDKLQDHLY